MKLSVVINPAAGQDEPVLAELNRVFDEQGVEWAAHVTQGEGDARSIARQAVRDGCDVVAAYGGDGTVSEVADGLLGTGVPLAILPGGTGNVIAQDLGVPPDLAEAALLACSPKARRRPMDTILANGRSHLLRIGIGADALVIRDAHRESKDRLGWLAYLYSALSQLRDPPSAQYTLRIDGREFETQAMTCIVANIGRLGRGGLSFSQGISPFDGLLDVLVIRSADWKAATALGAEVLGVGGAVQEAGEASDAEFQHYRGAEISIAAEPVQQVHADGEVLGKRQLELAVNKHALTMVLPGEDS